jgi:hypothetical protein
MSVKCNNILVLCIHFSFDLTENIFYINRLTDTGKLSVSVTNTKKTLMSVLNSRHTLSHISLQWTQFDTSDN